MCQEVKVLDKIDLSQFDKLSKVDTCDSCGDVVNNNFGETRTIVKCTNTSIDDNGNIIDDNIITNKMYCSYCIDEQFGDNSPHSIFG